MAKRKANKWLYLWVVQGLYPGGYGWEDLTQSENHREAKDDLNAYKFNEGQYPHRLIKRRELNPEYTDGQADG